MSGSCNDVAEDRAGRRLDLVEYRQTREFQVFICSERSRPGRLWYHGVKTDGDPRRTSITLPAEQTGRGYVANNDGWVYEVRADRVVLTSPTGRAALDQEFV